jgi:propionate CoA-transferase
MHIWTKAYLLYRALKWRMTWNRRNTHYRFTVPDNPKFMGPRDAVRLIKDGAVVGTSGLGGNQWPSILYWAIREVYEETGHPRDLGVVAIGGMGGRGIAPGSVDELGVEGLCTRFFTGHAETFKSVLRLADADKLELQIIPQGTMALILASLANGEDSRLTETGAGTFIDPRVGRGTPLRGGPQYVAVEDGKLRYTCPKIDVAVFNAPAADRKGNIYVKGASLIAESYEISRAARRNGGVVIANVGLIVEEGYDKIFLPADEVDAVVYYPGTEQHGSAPHRKPTREFALNSPLHVKEGLERIHFVNHTLGITPRRSAADFALARLAASVFAEHSKKGACVDIGVGLPEEVCRLLFEGGLLEELTLMTESGVFGGVPAPGVFFGASLCPKEIVSSAEAFRRIYEHLDAVIVGALQIDSAGNVNVSKRGEGAINYVGPGGFIDLTTCAKMVLFCSSWGDRARFAVEGARVRVVERGKPKFMEQVDEVTFNGQEALRHGKQVFYVTHVGAFQLTARGMELIRVMPGIDIQRDILDASAMRIVLPENGIVPVVPENVVTGKGFRLTLAS